MKNACGHSWDIVGCRVRTSALRRRAKYIAAPSGPNMCARVLSIRRSICEAFGCQEGSGAGGSVSVLYLVGYEDLLG